MKTLHPFALLLAFAACLEAATIAGRVTDATGGVVAGARVTATANATARRVVVETDAAGIYVMVGLAPGSYEILVEKAGFKAARRAEAVISVAGAITSDFTLDVGQPDTVVVVEGTPGPIERDVTAAGTVINRRFVENLPLNGRSFQSLLELTPGVVLTRASVLSPGQFSANGQRGNANFFLVDGVAANVAASPFATFSQQAAGTLPGLTVLGGTNSLVTVDALEEFRIQTSTFAAEFGRTPGAQVSLVTRSGSNRFRGSWFHELRNEKLDANDWFTNQAGRGRSPFRLNQFGGAFSGPVVKDRTFFFATYEGLRLRQPTLVRAQVPTVESRTAAPAAIRPLLNAFPLPTGSRLSESPGSALSFLALYEAAISNPATQNIGSLRVDHTLRAGLTLFGRINFAPTESASRGFSSMLTTTFTELNTYTGGATWAVSPRLVNELRVNYSGSNAGFYWEGLEVDGAVRVPDSALFPAYANRENASANFSFGLSAQGLAAPNLTVGRAIGNRQRQVNVIHHVSYVNGRHQWKFGIDVRPMFPVADFREFGFGYNFGNMAAAITTGRVQSLTVQALAPRGGVGFPSWSGFAQDTWRVTPKLTLNLGMRWEIVPAPEASESRPVYNLDQIDNLLTAQLAPAKARLWPTRWNNFGPRFGVSWQTWGGLVLKSGIGLFHDLGTGQAVRGFNSWPYNTVRSTANAAFPAPAEALAPIPFHTQPPYSAEFFFTDPNLRQPYTVHWNVSLERAFGRTNVSAGWVAAAGRRLLFTEALRNRAAIPARGIPENLVVNPALFGIGATGSSVNLIRNAASSDYQSLQVQGQRRVARGLQAQLAYTWSHSIDNFSDETALGIPVDRLNRDLDRGPSDFDVRHNFTLAVTYDLPSPGGALGKRVLQGWSLDSFVRARTATPVNVFTGEDLLNLGITTVVRPDRTPGAPLFIADPGAPGGRRVNRAAFSTPAANRPGTLGRNSLRGFSAGQADVAVRRRFAITDTVALTFRAEAFNILNRANFADPVGNLASPIFGLSDRTLARSLSAGTGAGFSPLFQVGGPRSLQFALRLAF